MTSPYLDQSRSIAEARLDLRAKRYGLLLDQLHAEEAGNRPRVAEIDREMDAIDRQLRTLEDWL